MITRLAKNQVMAARESVTMTLYSETIPVGDYTNGTGHIVVHYLQDVSSNSAKLSVFVETSNDNEYWDASAGASLSFTDASSGADKFTIDTTAAYVRLRYEFNPADSGTDPGSAMVAFDVHARFYTA